MIKICIKCNIEKYNSLFNSKQSKCRICQKRYDKEYRMINKKAKSIRDKEYRQKHKEEATAYQRLYQKKRRKSNFIYRLIDNRRHRRWAVLKLKYNSAVEDLGCSPVEWRNYIESKFDSEMNWNNYGPYWELDEIIPCYAWNMTNQIEQKACFHYLNSRPLEKESNRRRPKKQDYTKEKQQFLMVLRALDIL